MSAVVKPSAGEATAIRPFSVNFPDSDLEDLRRQVERGDLIRQPVRSCRLQLSSPARFDEVNRNPGTHLSLPHPRRTQIAPSALEAASI